MIVIEADTQGIAKMQAWRTAHPPHRGRWFLATHPMVHKGFLQTWKANQLSERVLQRVLSIVDAGSVPSDAFEIFLTGMFPVLPAFPSKSAIPNPCASPEPSVCRLGHNPLTGPQLLLTPGNYIMHRFLISVAAPIKTSKPQLHSW